MSIKNIYIKKIIAIVGIFVGLIICGSGFSDNVSIVSSEKYGGEAYTGIQNASARTANNVMNLERTFLKVTGILTILNYTYKLFDDKEEKE